MKRNQRILAIGAAFLLPLALGACGGSSNDNGSSQTANPGASDAFVTRVLALIGSSPDNTEPVATDDITVTSPNDVEPAQL
jgi:hypothetical protein